jgi:cobalt-zinc-cadmium resistance protein CzcA
MLNWIIDWSLRNRLAVIVLTLGVVVWGCVSMWNLPIDAFPDTTPVQVQINTVAPSLTPEEVEQQVTIPVENLISGLQSLIDVRSISRFGLSQLTVTFEDGTDIYFARQIIAERLGLVELPNGIEKPKMGPVATGLGEVFHYIVKGAGDNPASLTELTTLHEWVIEPRMRQVPGIAEINTWGGRRKQFEVVFDPTKLIEYNLTIDDLSDALKMNNKSVGGGLLTKAGESTLVHGVALTTTIDEIADIVVSAENGTPIYIRDIALVREGYEIRRGAVTSQGEGEVVLGLGFMLMGENSHTVTRLLSERVDEIRKSLPENVELLVMYERTKLIDHVIHTVQENLLLGALFVIIVLFTFLGNLRAALIVAISIPLAMLFSFSMMAQFGIAASLLSLGAIDFGLVVDSAVIMTENSVRRIGEENQRGSSRRVIDIVRDACVEVRKPTMFGELIIMIVFIPILLLEGVEGKMFRPMALTVIFALASAILFSMTLTPVLCSIGLGRRVEEKENRLVLGVQWVYRPFVRFALRFRMTTLTIGLAIIASGGVIFSQLGSSFLPRLYEEAIAVNLVRLAGVSLDQSTSYNSGIEELLLEKYSDEIEHVWSRVGTAVVATDPMGLEMTDTFITLKPRDQWTAASTQAELTELMSLTLEKLPGVRAIFTQPIEMRMNEMVAGVRSDFGVKIYGDDLDQLRMVASQVQGVLESIPGSTDVASEQITGTPLLSVHVDQQAIARYGIPAQHVLEIVEALGEIHVGEVRDGQRRFDMTLKLEDRYRSDPDAVADILVPTPGGERITLGQLADVSQVDSPSVINRDWSKRRIVVQCNVRGRDLGGFVDEVRDRLSMDIAFPDGYYVSLTGQFEHLERATRRLTIIIPIVIVLIFSLLYFSIGSVRDSIIVLTGVPFAIIGGVFALFLRDLELTISAIVGFIAVSGVAMLSGLVLVSCIRQQIEDGMSVNEAIEKTRLIRLRPILMTGLVASLGFVPMAFNSGVGAEIQRPLATVVIGGIIADNVLTLFMLPAIYSLWGGANSALLHRE